MTVHETAPADAADPVLALVRAARPDTDRAVAAVLADRGPAVLAAVLATAPAGPRAARTAPPARRPGHRWARTVGLSAAAALAATLGVLALPGAQGTAYAGWTPHPQELGEDQQLLRARACATGFGDPATPEAAVTTADLLVSESRGPYVLTIVAAPTATVFCQFLTPDATAPTAADLVPAGDPVAGDGVAVDVMSGGGTGSRAWSAAAGRMGPEVSGVDLLTEQGTVRASTAGGRWTAWWPGADGGDADAVRVVVHTADGDRVATAGELVPGTPG